MGCVLMPRKNHKPSNACIKLQREFCDIVFPTWKKPCGYQNQNKYAERLGVHKRTLQAWAKMESTPLLDDFIKYLDKCGYELTIKPKRIYD